MTDIKKRRRQVSWLCFQPYLSEEQRVEAIQILDRDYQTEGMSSLIAYVTRICSEFGIDMSNRIALYGQFRELMKEETVLSIDPLSFGVERDHDELRQKQAEPKLSPFKTDPADSTVAPKLTAHTVIFIYFMKQVYTHLAEKSALFQVLKELSLDKRQGKKDMADNVNRWAGNPNNFAWAVGLDEKTLASLVHLVYTGLCEILGPIHADECFHKAIAQCEKLPEAKAFSPSRFL
ncbi:hypothetical protein [Crenothrix polyspora]|uniref:Uncharacterized protein n=1 Tax=Crenothrix polyspora TaxID=360316 RepID=A0A1R4HJW1_9GAMM|nr:hypothetical protein [Crenothrix polyspora]SJM96509.1 hypothetical protein CRENPOLYSF1_900016 [Crenothrix polyspora]